MERCKSMMAERAHELFRSNVDYAVDCCPSATQQNRRTFAINQAGLVFELLQDDNFTQEFKTSPRSSTRRRAEVASTWRRR